MTNTKFMIDSAQIVHTSYCQAIGEKPLPYVASRVVRDEAGKPLLDTVHDYVQMAVHLAGPDVSNGLVNQAGSTMLKPCPLCVPSD